MRREGGNEREEEREREREREYSKVKGLSMIVVCIFSPGLFDLLFSPPFSILFPLSPC